MEGELVGINLKDHEKPTLDILVPGFKTPWTCDANIFKPYLKPLFPTIYEKQEDGKVPWLEYQKRWYGDRGGEFLESLISWKFEQRKNSYDRWWYFEGKTKINGKESDLYETATFYHHLAYEVGYEMGIDVNDLIEEGKAILWEKH